MVALLISFRVSSRVFFSFSTSWTHPWASPPSPFPFSSPKSMPLKPQSLCVQLASQILTSKTNSIFAHSLYRKWSPSALNTQVGLPNHLKYVLSFPNSYQNVANAIFGLPIGRYNCNCCLPLDFFCQLIKFLILIWIIMKINFAAKNCVLFWKNW